jgi:hypothetical protein
MGNNFTRAIKTVEKLFDRFLTANRLKNKLSLSKMLKNVDIIGFLFQLLYYARKFARVKEYKKLQQISH